MDQKLLLLFNESIQLESNVADLYVIFQDTFPEDADFWKTLIIEERNHSALLKSGKEHFVPVDTFPVDMLSAALEELKDTNTKLVKLISQYQDKSPCKLHLSVTEG